MDGKQVYTYATKGDNRALNWTRDSLSLKRTESGLISAFACKSGLRAEFVCMFV